MAPQVSVQIVTWNSCKYLKDCLDSVFSQDFNDFSVLVIDNASVDGTTELIREKYPQVYLLTNPKNYGFSRAHNQGFRLTDSEFVLVLNPDVILEPDFLTVVVQEMNKDKTIGSLGGLLLQVKCGDAELDEKIKTNIIDSSGLEVLRSRRVIDRGQGEVDKGQYDQQKEVFGISGACVLYRRKALEAVKVPINKKEDEYFDQDFFAYKEDIDLAWRLRLAGWKSIYQPQARGYHFRGVMGHKGRLTRKDLKVQNRKTPQINLWAYRNHLWLLVKNSYPGNFFRHFLFISFYLVQKKIYLLCAQPGVMFKGSFSFLVKLGKMLRKRRYIFQHHKIRAKEMRKWLSGR